MNRNDAGKLPDHSYTDLSDYARGVAVFLIRPFVHTSLRAWHVTWIHFVVMVIAAGFVSTGTLAGYGWAALLIMLKNILDAADGSLARLQERPSRVGRFLDSNLDLVGNLVFFLAIPQTHLITRLMGFLSFTFQGSVFNYYAVRFRTDTGGDATSRVTESACSPYPYDNPLWMGILYRFYRYAYGWQDAVVRRLDGMLDPDDRLPSRRLMELFSVLGPGFQYLFVILLLLMGIPQLAPDLFTYGFNIYMVCLFLLRAEE